jgi:PAX-interacting protein 1
MFFFCWPTVPGGEPVMDMSDCRIQLQPDSRKRIVEKFFYLYERKGEGQKVN